MKTIVKIYDSDCPICEYFSQFDEEICKRCGFSYFILNLYSTVNFPDIYSYLRTLTDSNGFVDVPTYLIMGEDGSVKTHLLGDPAMTKEQFSYFIGKLA